MATGMHVDSDGGGGGDGSGGGGGDAALFGFPGGGAFPPSAAGAFPGAGAFPAVFPNAADGDADAADSLSLSLSLSLFGGGGAGAGAPAGGAAGGSEDFDGLLSGMGSSAEFLRSVVLSGSGAAANLGALRSSLRSSQEARFGAGAAAAPRAAAAGPGGAGAAPTAVSEHGPPPGVAEGLVLPHAVRLVPRDDGAASAAAASAASAALGASAADPMYTQTRLGDAYDMLARVAILSEQIRLTKRQMIAPDAPLSLRQEGAGAVARLDAEAAHRLRSVEAILEELWSMVLLDASETTVLLQMRHEVNIQRRQLSLYQDPRGDVRCALVISAQPFPLSVRKGHPFDEPIVVRVLCGALVDPPRLAGVAVFARVSPSFAGETPPAAPDAPQKKRKKKPPAPSLFPLELEHCEARLNEHGIAVFSELQFAHGSRLRTVRLVFEPAGAAADAGIPLDASEESESLVVKTNESQWYDSEGLLLRETAFGPPGARHASIPYTRLFNAVQRRYLLATRQGLQTPTRPLTGWDRAYFQHVKLGGRETVTLEEFDVFWRWLGPLLHKVRSQRHLCSLWLNGFVPGFLTREEVEAVLANEAVGTFLIRVSSSVPGGFVVAYQSQQRGVAGEPVREVKHYLVREDDTAGAKITLPDFLREYRDLMCILQLHTDASGKRTLGRCQKDDVLREFYSRRTDHESLGGYDDTIHVL